MQHDDVKEISGVRVLRIVDAMNSSKLCLAQTNLSLVSVLLCIWLRHLTDILRELPCSLICSPEQRCRGQLGANIVVKVFDARTPLSTHPLYPYPPKVRSFAFINLLFADVAIGRRVKEGSCD